MGFWLRLFLTLILAWFHGEKGQQKASAPEIALIVGLVVCGASVTWLVRVEPADLVETASSGSSASSSPLPDLLPGADAREDLPRLAILPWPPLGGERVDSVWADAILDELITRFEKVGGLSVISRTSVMQYRDEPTPIREIQEELRIRDRGPTASPVRRDGRTGHPAHPSRLPG